MTQRAVLSRGNLKRNALVLAAMGSAVILLGCGGGGGGTGPGPSGVCGSAAGSSATVICGYVVNSSQTAVSGATVTLKNAASQTVGSSVITDSAGFFKFTNPTGAALFQVTPPANYDANTIVYTYNSVSGTYAYYRNAADNNPCIPALPTITAGADNRIGVVTVQTSNPPPPPVLTCPR